MAGLSLRLTARQREQLGLWRQELLRERRWSGALPVALLEPCWLRLRRVPVERLASVLPPDGSEAAPELERYRQLRAAGVDDWSAQLQCWHEFGTSALQQAQRRFWRSEAGGNRGWTLGRYLALLAEYRRSMAPGEVPRLPVLVLAPEAFGEEHQVIWLPARSGPIGHTCP